MNLLRWLRGEPERPPPGEPTNAQRKVEAQLTEIKAPKARLEALLETEATGFVLGDAVLGRKEVKPWTTRRSGR